MVDSLLLLVTFARAIIGSRADLAVENLLLRQQLAVVTRPTRKRPRLRPLDSAFWALTRRLRRDWRHHVRIVRPGTVIRWHRRGWRRFWRWRSAGHLGRPPLAPDLRELLATMARDNPRWGSERIRGELLKLGIAVSKRSIQRYRGRGPARPPSQTWRTFLATHRPRLWAADRCTVQTLTFKTLDVLVLIAHGRRELVHAAVTAHPAAAGVWRQVVGATAWGRRPHVLLRDRDSVYGGDCGSRLAALGIEQLLTPVRAPRANAVAARLVGTLRRECLEHLIVLNERHLRAVLTEFARCSNRARPHRTLSLEPPLPAVRPTTGPIRARPVLGGLHHTYERAA